VSLAAELGVDLAGAVDAVVVLVHCSISAVVAVSLTDRAEGDRVLAA
jgi:hypothetical protein